MTDDHRWQQVDALFEKLIDLPPEEREAALRECPDEALRADVRRLLADAAKQDTFLSPGAHLQNALDELSEETIAHPGSPGPGSVLAGRYRLERRIGEGGMGDVYRARDSKLERDVAVKLVRGSGFDARWRERLLREARAAATLNHPNVVVVHDVGEEQGNPFFVMELVAGKTLDEDPPRDLAEIRETARQVCDALEHAHRRGIVHRDLKPANLLVVRAEDGTRVTKLTDLGIALARDTSRITGGGMILGTPAYMAPEQATGGKLDARTDLYALGVMLYEWCTGAPPFIGGDAMSVISQHIHTEPKTPRTVRPGLPPDLDRAISRLLAKKPEDRFESAAEVRRSLDGAGAAPGGESASLEHARLGGMPKPRTRLIGRTRECARIRRLIVEDQARLITLTGPGGCGKTRLAQQAAEDLAPHFGSRVHFVSLVTINEPDLVAPAIAHALGIRGAHSAFDAIQGELVAAREPVLLILDNFEQVVEAAPVIGDLLEATSELVVIVTSREVLRLYGEHDVPVPTLEVPPRDAALSLAELQSCPAVTLFVERARAASSEFRLTEANAACVAELCTRLDGLPLALELAAAHARMLSPKAMLERLESRMSLLTTRARDLPGRQQTLRGTLDWSYELVDEPEQILFRRLGVFAGGFTLEAVEAVADPFGRLALSLADGVASLVDKSLLQRVGPQLDEPRFAMLETIREYALEKLSDDDDAGVRKAHAAYYVVLAEEAGGKLGTGEEAWLAVLAREHDNFRAALEWLTEQKNADWGLRLALALFHFWERAEHLSEARRRFAALLALDSSSEVKPLRARGIFAAGALAATQGALSEAVALQGQSYELHREMGDERGMAVALNGVGIAQTSMGEFEAADRSISQTLDIWERLDDTVGYARTLSNLAYVRKMQGFHEESRKMYERASGMFDSAGDRLGAAWAINHQADVAVDQGDLKDADKLYRLAFDAFGQLANHWGIATCLADMGALAYRSGDRERAGELYRDALVKFAALGHKRGIARLLEALAALAGTEKRAEDAVTLAAVAATLRERIGAPSVPREGEALAEQIAKMRERLGAERAAELWKKGADLPLSDAILLAVEPS